MADTLHLLGDNFVSEPAMIAHLKLNRMPFKEALAEGIADAAMGNPLFSDVVIYGWKELVAQVDNEQHLKNRTTNPIVNRSDHEATNP